MTASSTCIIFNPRAGRGRAARDLEHLRQQVGTATELRPTNAPGHAEELALEAARSGFEGVAAVGGDGTVHEVANGILRSGRTDVVLHVLPGGSANDYAYSLDAEQPPGTIRRVDVGLARREDGRERYFINGFGLGFNGAVTLEARRIRWLRGVPLYSFALLRTLCFHYECPPLTISRDGAVRKAPTLALSINLGRREGGFLLTPNAHLGDGWFDYLHAGDLRRWELVRYLPRMITGRLPTDHPKIWMGRCREVTVQAETPLTVHLDGEFLCQPADRMRRVEVRLLPEALAVATAGGRGAAMSLERPTGLKLPTLNDL
jgi:diacylglycerol kinase (ATP)